MNCLAYFILDMMCMIIGLLIIFIFQRIDRGGITYIFVSGISCAVGMFLIRFIPLFGGRCN